MSIKLSPDSSFIELLRRDSSFVEIDDDPVLLLCLISTTSKLLVKFGILQHLSNNSSNELLMIGIVLVKNSSKPTIFGTGDSDEPLKSSSFNCLYSPLSKCSSFKAKKEQVYIIIDIIFKIRNRVIGRKRIKHFNLPKEQNIEIIDEI